MDGNEAVLHLLVGKICAGKSTLAAEIGRQPGVLVVSEDVWLTSLFDGEMHTVADYVRCSARLRDAMETHLIAILAAGVSVVLDFPANTPEMRNWMRHLIEKSGCAHRMHFLNMSDELCRARLHNRNRQGDHPFKVTDEQFTQFTHHFSPPSSSEGFDVVVYREDTP